MGFTTCSCEQGDARLQFANCGGCSSDFYPLRDTGCGTAECHELVRSGSTNVSCVTVDAVKTSDSLICDFYFDTTASIIKSIPIYTMVAIETSTSPVVVEWLCPSTAFVFIAIAMRSVSLSQQAGRRGVN